MYTKFYIVLCTGQNKLAVSLTFFCPIPIFTAAYELWMLYNVRVSLEEATPLFDILSEAWRQSNFWYMRDYFFVLEKLHLIVSIFLSEIPLGFLGFIFHASKLNKKSKLKSVWNLDKKLCLILDSLICNY